MLLSINRIAIRKVLVPMESPEPITHWLRLAQSGDSGAAQPLWEHFFRRLVALARKRLDGAAGGAANEEDVALSVLNSFFRGAREGAYPDLNDRADLWRLLVFKTVRRAIDELRRERAQKRPGCRARASDAELQQVIGREPTPALSAEFADGCRQLLDQLPPDLRQIAGWRLEGHTVQEIAEKLGVVSRTVIRRLGVIRDIWGEEDEP
jgi:RNA polymerase sigma factor (sigma-70 family)